MDTFRSYQLIGLLWQVLVRLKTKGVELGSAGQELHRSVNCLKRENGCIQAHVWCVIEEFEQCNA